MSVGVLTHILHNIYGHITNVNYFVANRFSAKNDSNNDKKRRRIECHALLWIQWIETFMKPESVNALEINGIPIRFYHDYISILIWKIFHWMLAVYVSDKRQYAVLMWKLHSHWLHLQWCNQKVHEAELEYKMKMFARWKLQLQQLMN